MKKQMVLLAILILIPFMMVLSSCSKKEIIKLDEPSKFEISNSILSWDKVNNAEEYIVSINNNEFTSDTNSFDLSVLQHGINKVQVKAKSYETKDKIFQQSDYAESLYIKKLPQVSYISLSYNSIYWNEVEDAVQYNIEIFNNGERIYNNYTTKTYENFNNVKNVLNQEGQYIISVTAIANNNQNFYEEGNIIFKTINSNANVGGVINVSYKTLAPSSIKLNEETQQIEWEEKSVAMACSVEIIDRNNNIVFNKIVNKDTYGKYYISLSELDIISLTDLKIIIKARAPEEPTWYLGNNTAICAMEDSEVVEFEIKTNNNDTLPTVDNIRFSGETSYLTSIVWDNPVVVEKVELQLIDNKSNILYKQSDLNSGLYLATPYNEFIRALKNTGKYKFGVKSLLKNNEKLYIYNNKIVQFKNESDLKIFEFNVHADSSISAPTNIQLSDYYVGCKIQWDEPQGAMAFEYNIKDNNGNIIYSGFEDINYNGSICYCNTDIFTHYIKSSGNYSISITALGIPQIGREGLTKLNESEPVEFIFYFDYDKQEITNSEAE